MNPQLQSLLNDVDDLVSPPDVYLEIRQIIDCPTSSAEDAAAAVSRDPALAARFLRIANSALFARVSEISLISRAVAALGTQMVRDLVLVASVADMFSGIDPKIIDVRAFWARSVECGVLAKVVAEEASAGNHEARFIEGLLAEIGHMAMYLHRPDVMQEIAKEAGGNASAMCVLESKTLGYNYCEAGAGLARAWGLPQSLQTTIAHHQQPATAEDAELETAIVHIASRLIESRAETELSLDDSAVALTGITPEAAIALQTSSVELISASTSTFGALDSAA